MKNNIKTEPTFYLYKKMWDFSKWNRKNVVLHFIFSIIANLSRLTEPLLFGIFINELQLNWVSNNNLWYLISILLLMFSIVFVFWFFHWISRMFERKNAFLVRMNYKKYLLEKSFDFGLNWHNDRQSWDSIDKIEKATSSLYEFSGHSFAVIKILIKAIWTIIVLLYFSFYISLWISIWIILGFYILSIFDKKLVPQIKSINLSENKISAKIYDSLSNITSIIILNIKKLVLKDIEKSFLLPKKVFDKNIVLHELKWFTWSVFLRFINIAPLIWYILYSYNQKTVIEIWTISALYLYLFDLDKVFFGFTELYWKIIAQKASVENADEIENKTTYKEEKKKLSSWFKKLEIKKLQFNYKDSKKILDDINLSIKAWEKIAIIWHSGSWKTTFLKLIHWLYQVSSWEIIVNNKNYKSFSDIDLQTTLVPQEPELFVASVRENITFWLNYSDNKIKNFTDMSCFSEVIDKLPRWLDSNINEKWVNLSWWQKQRLALARALLFAEKKKIILLDESTSSVDSENEMIIYRNILKNFSSKTIISSIHKLNLLKLFDKIIMFDNWKIVDIWDFNYLLKNNKRFAKAWKDYID